VKLYIKLDEIMRQMNISSLYLVVLGWLLNLR